MNRFLTKIIVAVLLVVLLPITFLITRQLIDLTKNEELVQNAFDQQLESLLFTINQNSENYLNSWVYKLDIPVDLSGDIMQSVCQSIFVNNTAVKSICFWDIELNKCLANYSWQPGEFKKVTIQDQTVYKLQSNLKENYQRLETIEDGEQTHVLFALKSFEGNVLGAISIHTKTFIDQNLSPGIQQIASDLFVVSIVDTLNATEIHFNDSTSAAIDNIHKQKMWYIPNHIVTISLQSNTIEELVQTRSQRENYIFIGMFLVVIIGVTFVIVTIRKEIKLAEMKSEFVANVSHEIRTPLALISMYSETLLLDRIKDKAKKTNYLQVIYSETNRLTEIVNRILTFSKMEKNKKNYQFQSVNVNDIINEVITHYQPHLINEKVKCVCELDEQLPVINADRDALYEAFVNLIENAIKYNNKSEKKIMVSSVEEKETVLIEIKDNGIGISSKHQNKIFDKFYRVTKGNLANKVKGTGIGLNIVKEIVDNHKGKIKVSSKLEEGSTFSIQIPKNLS